MILLVDTQNMAEAKITADNIANIINLAITFYFVLVLN